MVHSFFSRRVGELSLLGRSYLTTPYFNTWTLDFHALSPAARLVVRANDTGYNTGRHALCIQPFLKVALM